MINVQDAVLKMAGLFFIGIIFVIVFLWFIVRSYNKTKNDKKKNK